MKDYVRMSESMFLECFSVDFKSAFNNLGWIRVIKKLREIGCEEMPLWRSYFQGRWASIVGVNDVV